MTEDAAAMEERRRILARARNPSLAKVLHDYGRRWEVERVERHSEWVAVLRDIRDDYVRIVAARDLGTLSYRMDDVEREEPPGAEVATCDNEGS